MDKTPFCDKLLDEVFFIHYPSDAKKASTQSNKTPALATVTHGLVWRGQINQLFKAE